MATSKIKNPVSVIDGTWSHTVTQTEAANSVVVCAPSTVDSRCKKLAINGVRVNGTNKEYIYNQSYFIITGLSRDAEITVYFTGFNY